MDRHSLRGLWYVKGILLLWHLVNFIATVSHFSSIPHLFGVLTSNSIVCVCAESNASCVLHNGTLRDDDLGKNYFLAYPGLSAAHDCFMK